MNEASHHYFSFFLNLAGTRSNLLKSDSDAICNIFLRDKDITLKRSTTYMQRILLSVARFLLQYIVSQLCVN